LKHSLAPCHDNKQKQQPENPMKHENINALLSSRIAEAAEHSGASRTLAKHFPEEILAKFIDRLPPASREKIIDDFLIEKPVRRITRIILK
jgi:hypothetical protein